ncbi:MAG: transposase [Chlorobaculum sp.]|nr:transposase [Chlorobaculum sp.]
MSLKARKAWIDANDPLPIATQCVLTGTSRSTSYVTPASSTPDAEELKLRELIDKEYTRHPLYGSRKIKHYLRGLGYRINRKRVWRLMRKLGLAVMAPGPNTSKPHPQHKIYPYLLRGMKVTRPKQVWSIDITWCPLPQGLCIWWPSSTDTRARFSHDGCQTRWRAVFAWIVWRRRSETTAFRKSSTVRRVHSLPVTYLSRRS